MDSVKDKTRVSTDEPVVPPALDDATFSDLSMEWRGGLQTSLSDMQGLICYLLRKNQQLRVELSAANAHRRTQMKDVQETAKLTVEIARDESRYRTTVQIEGTILKATSSPGFAAASERVHLLSAKQALAEIIRRNNIMLAWTRS